MIDVVEGEMRFPPQALEMRANLSLNWHVTCVCGCYFDLGRPMKVNTPITVGCGACSKQIRITLAMEVVD